MKKYLIIISVLIVSFSFMFALACAQEAKPMATSMPIGKTVEYALPYPGILPGHPLFFIKNFRDWLLKMLISQPARKTEFELLLSDKSLSMAIFLCDQGKKDLCLKTLQVSVDHLQKTEKLIFEIPASEKTQINNIKDRFEKSADKHQEVINNLSLVFDSQKQTVITSLISNIEAIRQEYFRKK